MENKDYEDAGRLAVSMGGDADTMGAVCGSIAAAFYGKIPEEIYNQCWDKLPDDIKEIINGFSKFCNK